MKLKRLISAVMSGCCAAVALASFGAHAEETVYDTYDINCDGDVDWLDGADILTAYAHEQSGLGYTEFDELVVAKTKEVFNVPEDELITATQATEWMIAVGSDTYDFNLDGVSNMQDILEYQRYVNAVEAGEDVSGEEWSVYRKMYERAAEGEGRYDIKYLKKRHFVIDVDGDGALNAVEASEIMKYYVENSTGATIIENDEILEIVECLGDFNFDGLIDASDVSAILRVYAEMQTNK